MTDKYEIKRDGTSLEELTLPDDLRNGLLDIGMDTIESLYGAMVAAPDDMARYFSSLGVDYDTVKAEIYGILPSETIDFLEEPAPKYATGALLPQKDREPRRFIRRDDSEE